MGFSEYIVSAPFVQTFETGFASVISKDGTSARWASSMSCLYKALLAGRDGNRNRLLCAVGRNRGADGSCVAHGGALNDPRRRNDLDPAASRLIILMAMKDNAVKSQCGRLYSAIFLPLWCSSWNRGSLHRSLQSARQRKMPYYTVTTHQSLQKRVYSVSLLK